MYSFLIPGLTGEQSLFMPDSSLSGSHVQGMAHILRLRGHEQFHDPRGWGLFRLAHHRLVSFGRRHDRMFYADSGVAKTTARETNEPSSRIPRLPRGTK